MIDFTPTSRLRRKLKSRVATLQNRFQSSKVFGSFQDLRSLNTERVKDGVRKFKCTSSDVDDYDSDESNHNTLQYREFSASSHELHLRLSPEDDAGCVDKLIPTADDKNLLDKLGQKCNSKFRRYFQKTAKVADVNKRLKSQIWSSVVTIVVIEGKNLLACDPETGTSDPYVKFRLGNEKYKTRVVWRSLNPRWLEQFDLHLYDDGDQQLEITVWDKDRARDDFIGRTSIDLSALEREKTHGIWTKLEDAAGSLNLLLTISGTTASETISDLTSYEENPFEREIVVNRYAWHRTFHNIRDVGHLTVKVFRATGLAAADLGGKSDPFCVLELGNARLQTQTEYKTLSPSWQKIFTFNIKDMNNVLEMTVYDEDRDHKVEFLGKIAIPLLRIKNGEKRWYALKDKKLRSRAKGSSPQILLEMAVIWNPIRACIRTLNPREEKYMQTELKFKRQVFVKNVLRLKVIVMHFYEYGKILQ
ncbi:C2 domain containing protein [Oryctes borbonicus]|uniref:C2 domain containing protein n=1 Tax=Oryctes borbonicus TaxID=1629725 RepID=A0A0T6BEN0_9SCAR|nr:C2 domain containing protein [Oryctes borbonicus]